jgi:hypothetical protein
MATYVIQATGTSQALAINNGSSLNSTKVKVTTSVPIYYAVGSYPQAFAANSALIPGNTTRDINLNDVPSYTSIASTGSTTGSGATFNISRVTGLSWGVTVATSGSGYFIGNVLTIAGTDLGGNNYNNVSVTITDVTTTSVVALTLLGGSANAYSQGATLTIVGQNSSQTSTPATAGISFYPAGTGYGNGNVIPSSITLTSGGSGFVRPPTVTITKPSNVVVTGTVVGGPSTALSVNTIAGIYVGMTANTGYGALERVTNIDTKSNIITMSGANIGPMNGNVLSFGDVGFGTLTFAATLADNTKGEIKNFTYLGNVTTGRNIAILAASQTGNVTITEIGSVDFTKVFA